MPEEVPCLVRVHVRDSALVVVARLSTQRAVHRLRGKAGDVLAEFSDDHVHAETLYPKQSSQRWREWELELIDGHHKLLDASQNWVAAPETATVSVVDPSPETVTYRCACGFTLDEDRESPA